MNGTPNENKLLKDDVAISRVAEFFKTSHQSYGHPDAIGSGIAKLTPETKLISGEIANRLAFDRPHGPIEPSHEPSDSVRESSERLRMPFPTPHDSFFAPHGPPEPAHGPGFRPHEPPDAPHGPVEAAHG